MKHFLISLALFVHFITYAQVDNNHEKYPVFPVCEEVVIDDLAICFKEQVQHEFRNNFVMPEIIQKDEYTGNMNVLFEVTEEGNFKVIFVDATYAELKKETDNSFSKFPKIKSGTFNGRNVYTQYSMVVLIPSLEMISANESSKKTIKPTNLLEAAAMEYDSIINLGGGQIAKFDSGLNIPFSHQNYAKFDYNINVVGTNSHTAVKPYNYSDVSRYYDFESNLTSLQKDKKTWFGKKIFNEHLVAFQGEGYWFTADVVADLQMGKDLHSEYSKTYNNTRAINVRGGLGEKLNFYATIYESQGFFADYVNDYARSIAPDGGNPGIVPGVGIAKAYRDVDFDYPSAEGYISYRASKMFNAQFGHGKNFIGDGYRSLFLSDAASPNPYLKLNTNFWKLKYTNTWMWLKDVRPDATTDGAFGSKYMATHFLSWNVTKKLNIGFFESVLWFNANDRGFDVNYLNPIIFYRAIEFSTGSRSGNALIGLSGKYKVNNNVNIYGQLIIDEFSSKDVFGGNKSWKNKLGFQLGAKYYNAFKVKNLMLQAEYNQVRPYTYSHDELLLNYGHNNQSMAHLWGANFREFIGIAHYNKKRWYGMTKLIYGQRGLDTGDGFSYGSDVFADNDLRPSDDNINLLQGNKTNVMIADVQLGYLLNPSTNLKVFVNITQRNFSPENAPIDFKENTTWVNFGFRTDLSNMYFDF